jgi:hypothetical protein
MGLCIICPLNIPLALQYVNVRKGLSSPVDLFQFDTHDKIVMVAYELARVRDCHTLLVAKTRSLSQLPPQRIALTQL